MRLFLNDSLQSFWPYHRRRNYFRSRLSSMADTREKALQDYRKKLLEHKEVDGRLKECRQMFSFVCVLIYI